MKILRAARWLGVMAAACRTSPVPEPPSPKTDVPEIALPESPTGALADPPVSASPSDDSMARITGAKGVEIAERKRVEVEDFWLDRTEVTVDAYERCVAAGVCTALAYEERDRGDDCRGQSGELPVRCVAHVQADTYCWWVGKRLPSYPELILAALGPTGGLDLAVSPGLRCEEVVVGSVNGVECPRKGPGPVGRATADVTKDGVHDLLGNVAEWTSSERVFNKTQKIGYWRFGYDYTDELGRWKIARFLWGADPHPSYGFRCARGLEEVPGRPRPEVWRPLPQSTFPLDARWYRDMQKPGWLRDGGADEDEICRVGCVGFESDPDCVAHCKLARRGLGIRPECERVVAMCFDLHSTCGCAEVDGKCQQDCDERCYDAAGYTDCVHGDELDE